MHVNENNNNDIVEIDAVNDLNLFSTQIKKLEIQMLLNNEDDTKDVILSIPEIPLIKCFQLKSASKPNGLTIPTPVITTLWDIYSPIWNFQFVMLLINLCQN